VIGPSIPTEGMIVAEVLMSSSPSPVPDFDAITKASKKRKVDATGKAPVKRPRVSKKKKEDSMKASTSRGKASLKRPSDAEVASVRPVKLSKKSMSCPTTAATMTQIAIGVSGPKGAAGASGSKGVAHASGSRGAVTVKKVVTPVQKRRVPAIGVMTEASSAKYQESTPHGRMPRDSTLEFVLMLEPEASLQIAHGVGGASISDFASTIAAG
jgi:hypothetical protein